MMNISFGYVAISAAMLVMAPQANAARVTIDASITDNTLLDAGTHAGSFDWSGLLLPNLQINSASYSFTFADDADALTTGPRTLAGVQEGSYRFLYSTGGGGSDYYGYYERDRTETYTQTQSRAGEGAALTLGNASIAAGSGSTAATTTRQTSGASFTGSSSQTSGTRGYNYSYGCGSTLFPSTCTGYSPGSYNTYKTSNYVTETVTLNDQTGTFTVSGSITDPALFAEMRAGQGLTFSLGIQGDLLLSSGGLTLDVSRAVAAVPEPSSVALAGAGLAFVAGAVRRRRSGVA